MAEAISMVSFLTTLLTSAPLFLFLNVVICTILFTSRFSSKKTEEHRQLARPPSLIERVKSINFPFYHYPSPFSETHAHSEHVTTFVENREPTGVDRSVTIERAPSLLERVKSINFSSFYRSEQVGAPDLDPHESSGYEEEEEEHHHVRRSKSESESRVASETQPPEKMKKSASERVITAAEEEEKEKVERRRPATTKMEKTVSFGDEAVDAKADDFINRFKQQLKLQRLDSLLRYKEMLRGN